MMIGIFVISICWKKLSNVFQIYFWNKKNIELKIFRQQLFQEFLEEVRFK